MKKPGQAGLSGLESKWELGGCGAAAAVHHFGFKFGLEGLNLTKDGKAAGRAAHLALKLMEDFVQPLGRGPKGRVVLSG